jgi:hypothetical protein
VVSHKSAHAIALSAATLVGVALLMLGCGTSNSSSQPLTQAQALSIATGISNGVAQAVTGAFPVASLRPGTDIMRNTETSPNVMLPICTPTPSGEVCVWPVSTTFSCPGGGSMPVMGNITGSLSTGGAGSAQVQIAATPANCSVNGLVLNGNPQVNLAALIRILNDSPVWPLTGTETGGVTYGPNPSGSCPLNLTFTVNSNQSCTVTGTACGQSVSGNC